MKAGNKKKGFTLIELIVSIAILSIVASSLLGAFTGGFTTLMTMGRKSKAVEQASKVLDTINVREKTDIDSLFLYKLYDTAAYPGFKAGIISELNTGAAPGTEISDIAVEIANLTAPGSVNQDVYNKVNAQLYKVKVIIQYERGTKSISLSSFIPQGGKL